MSYKYIGQLNNENFVYPNYDLAEYDVNILHSINDNSVSGTCSSFATSSISSSSITINYSWNWYKNAAEVYINPSNSIHLLSVHALVNNQNYYKPWRLVDFISNGTTNLSTYSGSNSFTITPSQMGVASFATGTYYFELRFIGLKSIYPICQTLSITVP